MLKALDRVVPGIDVVRPDGTKAQFALYTDKDVELVKNQPQGGIASLSLDEISAVKQTIALDASDGKLDFKVNGLGLESPRYTIFWTSNSAQAMLLALAHGQRELRVNGKNVEVSTAFKQWVSSTMGLESMPG